MLYKLDLSLPNATITESPVSKTLGITDMYHDFEDATNQFRIEEQLSKLESNTGRIISRILKAFRDGESEFKMKRADRDTLRKFLFIMKYRASRMHQRFNHQEKIPYPENDKERLLKYMAEKGFKRPVDAWFDNIRVMLELQMDPEDKWMQELDQRIYPDDAKWFISHAQMMYLALCTPAEDDEFLLTENAYGIHEGPVSCVVDPNTGLVTPTTYTEHHMFAVISPKLIMVLRSVLLPVADEDHDENIRGWRGGMRRVNEAQHTSPIPIESTLADLPICKPENSYTKVEDGKRVLLDGEDGSRRADHTFSFRFFLLGSNHVNQINSIMLEESTSISTMVLNSKIAARRTFGSYLKAPSRDDFKLVCDVPGDLRQIFLKKLEQAARLLGSNMTAVYEVKNYRIDKATATRLVDEKVAEILEANRPKTQPEFIRLYELLGGSYKTLAYAMDQARKMLNMRIKIDVWSQGLNEDFREGIRDNVQALFCQLPTRRVWYYLKQFRHMLLSNKDQSGNERQLFLGPEDTFVRVCKVIRTSVVNKLMWFAALNDIQVTKHPELRFEDQDMPDTSGPLLLPQVKSFIFGKSGSIRDCGNSEIEKRARQYKTTVLASARYQEYAYQYWTEQENIEIVTRLMIKRDLPELLGGKLSTFDLYALSDALFDLVYPSV